ncbi:MAG: prephenate dehydratase [Succinivibrio sp.]|nr:prephenate dehydratase [Succinivibrio sp.]
MKDLTVCREEIDRIDNKIIELLSERIDVAKDIAEYKLQNNQKVSDSLREQQKISALMEKASAKTLPCSMVSAVFKEIIKHTVAFEQQYIESELNQKPLSRDTTVAFLGTIGTYSHLAAQRFVDSYHGKISNLSCDNFENIVGAVETGKCEYGVLPIENSSSGSINQVLDVLQGSKVYIVGELFYPIDHSILASENVELSEITDIYSHPQPVQQCSRWLADFLPHAKIHYTKASSEALENVSKIKDRHSVAIASHNAAAYYKLIPLHDNIANNTSNFTRFVQISMTPVTVPETIEAKTSIAFRVKKYEPGSLIAVLNEFSKNDINLTKLVSRPRLSSGEDTWEEIFFADVQGNLSSAVMQDILENIKAHTSALKVFGCYMNADRIPENKH